MIPSQQFIFKYAEPSEFEKVMSFYADTERRTQAVYLRDEEVIASQISKKLFLTVRDEDDTIVASSALYSLAQGRDIGCVANSIGDVKESGQVVELGSVLRMNHGKDDHDLPPGIWNVLLFGVPMIMAFNRAGSPELPIDILVADVQTNLTNTINHVTGAESTKSPLKWELMKPAQELVNSFLDTTRDENTARDKNFYRAPVSNLYAVAKSLSHIVSTGYITNHRGERIGLDFSGLELRDTLNEIVQKKGYFTKLPHNMSWSEARRLKDAMTFKDGMCMNGHSSSRPHQTGRSPQPPMAAAG